MASAATANEHFPGGDLLNDSVRAELLKLGDDGRTPRNVDHFAYPADEHAGVHTSKISGLLSQMGFVVRQIEDPDGLLFSHRTFVDEDVFDAVTLWLFQLMHRYDWEYDGWETEVVKAGGSS